MATQTKSEIPHGEIRAALRQLLASDEFKDSGRLRDFLAYAIEESLAGRAHLLRAQSIGVEVYKRGSDFDPQKDSIVRVEASRLRRKLAAHYSSEGADAAVEIKLAKGTYVPSFARRADATPSRARSQLLGRRALIIATAGITVLVAVSAYFVFSLGSDTPPIAAQLQDSEILSLPSGPSIAVLPFIAGDEQGDRLGRAISDELTKELTRFKYLFVLAPDSASALRNGGLDAAEAARHRGIRYLLDGTVTVDGNRLTVNAFLAEAATARSLWAETYEHDFDPEQLARAQQDIARRVVTAIAQPYGIVGQAEQRAADQRAPAASLVAYDCILAADRYYLTLDPAQHDEVRSCLEATVARTPNYGTAWAYLAYVILDELRYGYGAADGDEIIARAERAARKAVEVEPDNALAHRALAGVAFTAGDLAAFRDHAERALNLNPNDSEALADLGRKLAYTGSWERGLAMTRKAMLLNPQHPDWYNWVFAVDDFRNERYAEALTDLNLVYTPSSPVLHLLRAIVLSSIGRTHEARAALAHVGELSIALGDDPVAYFRRLNLDADLTAKIEDALSTLQEKS